jgi:hypothetical protein
MSTTAHQPTTFLDRDNWMRALLASDLPDAAVRLGIAIALHLSVQKGRCDPGHDRLGKDTGTSARSVRRWAAVLERDGWLAIKRGGRGHTSSYILLPADMTGHRVASQKRDMTGHHVAAQESFPDFDRPESAHMTGQNRAHDRPPAGRQKAYLTTKREKKGESQTLAPDFASRQVRKKADASKQARKNAAATGADVGAAFDRFWAIYPKRTGIDAARKAFERVVKDGADVDAVVARAALYAVERKSEPPRFTLDPKNWLKDGKWKDPPPAGLVLDGVTGEAVAVERPPPQRQPYDPSRQRWEVAEQLKRHFREREAQERAAREQAAAAAREDGDGYLH